MVLLDSLVFVMRREAIRPAKVTAAVPEKRFQMFVEDRSIYGMFILRMVLPNCMIDNTFNSSCILFLQLLILMSPCIVINNNGIFLKTIIRLF